MARRVAPVAVLALFLLAFTAWAISTSAHGLTPHSIIFLSGGVALLALVALTLILSLTGRARR